MIRFSELELEAVVEAIGARVTGAEVTEKTSGDEWLRKKISSIAEPLEADPTSITFLINDSFLNDIKQTKASVIVLQKNLADKVSEKLPSSVEIVLIADDAYLAFAKLSAIIAQNDPTSDWRLSSAAFVGASEQSALPPIHPTAKIDPSVKVAPGSVICEDAEIGARTVILPNVTIGPKVKIGEDCVIFPGCVIYPKTEIGNRVRLHANVVLGSDGFGYARGPAGSVKIWHLGRVIIGDDVEIGSGTTIDKGTIKDTVIELGAKLDNQVQVGHNGYVKMHAILCGQVGLAGNATIGVGAIVAGGSGVADKVSIGDGATVGGMTGVSKDVSSGEIILGNIPGRPKREWWRLVAYIDKLPEILDRLKKIEKNHGGRQ